MENADAINLAQFNDHFSASLKKLRAAEDFFDRTGGPEAALMLADALNTANSAAERVLSHRATNRWELDVKFSALVYRWRASDFDASQIEDDADIASQYGEGALAAFADLAADAEEIYLSTGLADSQAANREEFFRQSALGALFLRGDFSPESEPSAKQLAADIARAMVAESDRSAPVATV